jgi:hypothetical protein
MTLRRRTALGLVAGTLGALAAPSQAMTFFTIGTADLDAGYYRVASALCALVNAMQGGRMRCSPEPTPGSIYNLEALADRQIDMAVVQSDWQAHAWNGTSRFASRGPMTELRSVVSLHLEPVTLLVRRGSGITGIADLRGMIVDVGHPSSGRRGTMERLMAEYGLTYDSFLAYRELPTAAALEAMCEGRVDAAVVVTGHPSALIGRTLENCPIDMIGLEAPEVDAILAAEPAYSRTVIEGGTYVASPDPVSTFAVRATLVARADTPDDVVAAIVAAAMSAHGGLRSGEPLLDTLRPEDLAGAGATAPQHPAAGAVLAAAP